MSELDRAVEARITAHRPADVPPFDQLRRRRRQRSTRAAAAGAALVAAAVLAAPVALRAQLESLKAMWPEIRGRLQTQLLPSAEMQRRFADETGGRVAVAGLLFLNVPPAEVTALIGRPVEWQPRPDRALLHDRHADRTVTIVPFVEPESDQA